MFYLEYFYTDYRFLDSEFANRWVPGNYIGATRYLPSYKSQMQLPFSRCITTDFMSRSCRAQPLSFSSPIQRGWRPSNLPVLVVPNVDNSLAEYSSLKVTRPGTSATDFEPVSK